MEKSNSFFPMLPFSAFLVIWAKNTTFFCLSFRGTFRGTFTGTFLLPLTFL